jgi:hypothetical protein
MPSSRCQLDTSTHSSRYRNRRRRCSTDGHCFSFGPNLWLR